MGVGILVERRVSSGSEEEGRVEQWSVLRRWFEQRPTCEQAETLDKGPYGNERGVGGEGKGSCHTAQHLLHHLNGGNFGHNCQQRDNLIPHALEDSSASLWETDWRRSNENHMYQFGDVYVNPG